jgi:hypothetical protein
MILMVMCLFYFGQFNTVCSRLRQSFPDFRAGRGEPGGDATAKKWASSFHIPGKREYEEGRMPALRAPLQTKKSTIVFPGHMTGYGSDAMIFPAGRTGRPEMKVFWQNDDAGGEISRAPGTWPRVKVPATQADRAAAQLCPPAVRFRRVVKPDANVTSMGS